MNSTLTRFRVQTASPLEPLKAWHAISPESNIQSVQDLKNNVIQVLGLNEVDGEIVLELDGFILLPSSPAGVVRDGDIVTVRCKPRTDKRKATEDQPQKKRKTRSPLASSSLALPPPVATAKPFSISGVSSGPAAPPKPMAGHSQPVLSSSEEDTTSSDSDSGSEDDSESSSDSSESTTTDSDSDSDSDSESDTGPTPQPVSRQPPASVHTSFLTHPSVTPLPPARTAASQPPVPPGQGKPSTKNRNARRRELRKHLAAGTAFSLHTSRTATPATTPTAAPVVEPVITTQVKANTPIAAAKNANKNKRKGFDKDMAEAMATKITYGTPTPAAVSVESPCRVDSPAAPSAQNKSRYTHYHVVPPSQLKNLPSNVIVTSVDVEAVDGLEGVGEWFDGENRDAGGEMDITNDVSQFTANTSNKKIDWDIVDSEWERSWDSFPVIKEAVWKDLRAGTLLAYKSLAIDPTTCTPCTKIHLTRVISSPSVTGEAECFFIERPGAGDIGFGFGGKFGGVPEAEDEVEDEETGETRNVGFSEIEGWKIIT
ncbi:hypothetical protein OPQ81_001133 [Rhizoctonia solani]|nr:hypothetical protein OPQ81_001133 [Rhizoctonia solani]